MAAPIWQSGSALEFEINAGASLTIDVGARVSGADRVEEVFGAGICSSMFYDEVTKVLTLTDAPIIRDDEVIVVRFRAWNSDGSSEADFVITLKGSVLASLHNSLFFKDCVNYDGPRVGVRGASTVVSEMTDNDYETFSTETDVDIDMSDAAGNPAAIDYVFIKYKGDLTQYRFIPSGGIGSVFTRSVPGTIERFEGGTTDLDVNDWKHDLFPLASRVTATSVRMQFTGSNLQIHALMLLELGFEIEANSNYVDIGFNLVDRNGVIHQSSRGHGRRRRSVSRWKWEYDFSMILDSVSMEALRDWMEANPNFTFAPEFSRDPEQVFPAFFPMTSVQGQYFTNLKINGEQVSFEVAER